MADVTILNGDIGINYLANNRQKMMFWIGGVNSSYTMNELYSAMATLLDETTTIDSGTAFSAETPVEYTTGKIDSGDREPWYASFDLMEHITGGALRTSGWLRATGTNAGIVIAPVTAASNNIVVGDVGNNITHADADAGTLLEVISNGGTNDYLVIRPDSNAAANDFDSVSGNLTCNGHTAPQNAAATSGEQIWANLYSLGTIDPNVHLYMYQGAVADDADRVRLYSWNDNAEDWYDNGHIDVCVPLKNITVATWSIIDGGYVTVLGRKYGDSFASFEVACSITSGGRNPIPLQTSADLDNTTGIKKELTGTWTGTYVVGEVIEGGTSGARGITTAVNVNTSLTYIPIDDPQVDFQTAETITGETSTATSTSSGTPSNEGPAASTWFTNNVTPTVAFAYAVFDINDDGTDESYGITINCQNNPLSEVYEWLKYACRNGEITNDLDAINGERYIGGECYLSWTGTVTGTIAEGADVTQVGSSATGVVVAYSAADKVMLLRDVRGTFNTTGVITDNDNSGTVTPNADAVAFAPKTASPLGSFAGGTFFGARGVLLDNWISSDENSFILTPIEGGTKERPQAISIEVTNLEGGAETSELHDRVSVFRLDGAAGDIEKTEYNCAGGESVGDAAIIVGIGIAQDVPGKTTGGWLILVDDPAGAGDEYKIRYSSWTASTFTLANMAAFTTTATTNATQVTYATGGFNANVKRGDLVYNSTRAAVGYVKTVDTDNQLTLEGNGITGQVAGDTVEINCVPVSIVSADDLYVPFLDKIATGSSESVSIIYVSAIYFRVKVRNTRAAIPIKPYSSDGSTTGTDQSVPVIRTEDTIIS